MLVLKLKKGGTVLIDGGITITILRLGDGKVSLGIVAPEGKKIIRLGLDINEDGQLKQSLD